MAKKIVWSKNAMIMRKEILEYFHHRNKSKNYSTKLNQLFDKNAEQLLKFPQSGIQISNSLYRGKLIKDYYLIYAVKSNIIEVLLIWDNRQNPDKLKKLLGL